MPERFSAAAPQVELVFFLKIIGGYIWSMKILLVIQLSYQTPIQFHHPGCMLSNGVHEFRGKIIPAPAYLSGNNLLSRYGFF